MDSSDESIWDTSVREDSPFLNVGDFLGVKEFCFLSQLSFVVLFGLSNVVHCDDQLQEEAGLDPKQNEGKVLGEVALLGVFTAIEEDAGVLLIEVAHVGRGDLTCFFVGVTLFGVIWEDNRGWIGDT